jgi:RHS repeat-associated protein
MGVINIANGNLHIEIPLASASQRGGLEYSAKLTYDSRIWSRAVVTPVWVPATNFGWNLIETKAATFGRYVGTHTCQYPCGPPGQTCPATWYSYSNYFIKDFTGTRRDFPIYFETGNACHTAEVPTPSGAALDGSGYWMTGSIDPASVIVKAPDGTQVYPGLKDTNGNSFTTDASGNVVDTLNRTVMIKYANGVSRCTATNCYDVLKSDGTRGRISVTNTTVYVNTAFGQSGVTEYSGSFSVPSRIDLPDGTSYQFSYDSGTTSGHYGDLTGITLPAGGAVTFGYTIFSDSSGNKQRWGTSRVSGGGTWTYTPSTCGANCQKTTVHQPSGDERVYSFAVNNGAWNNQVQAYTGSATSGTLLATVQNTYDTTLTDPVNGGAGFVRLTQTDTTLPIPGAVNRVKRTKYEYDTFSFTYRGTAYTGSRGNVKTRSEYAFGTTGPGSLLRKTVTTYLYESNTSYRDANIVNRPSNVQTQDSGSAKKSETAITYDSTALTSVTGVTHHDDANYGTGFTIRGNPILIRRWISGTSYLDTTLTYDTTGQLRQSTDPKGNSTSYSYTDVYYTDNGADPPATYSPGVTTNAYVTQVTLPTTGSTTHSLSYGYYYGTGKAAKSTADNGQTTYSHFRDTLDRPTKVLFPDSGGNTWQYTGATRVDLTTFLTGSTNRTDRLVVDSYGRPGTRSLTSDPSGTVQVVTSYNTTGRVFQVTNPYRSTSDPTYGTDTPAYDGLTRTVSVTHSGGGSVQIAYGAAVTAAAGRSAQISTSYGLGYPTLQKDEAGKMRQIWTDALGRVIEVDEPDPATGSLTAGSYAGTYYAYDVLDNRTNIYQGTQTRTFTSDGLSRMTSSTTPEEGASGTASGTTNFYYTTAGGALCAGDSGAVCRQTDARGTTTTLSYDALDRLTQKSFSSGDTTVTYTYDQTACLGLSTCYNKGSRTGMSDASGSTSWAYDKMGRVLREQRTIGTVTKPTSYTYNLAGLVATITYPSGRTLTYGYNNAAQALEARDTANSINYAVSAAYAPPGGLSSAILGQVSGGFAGITSSYGYNNRLQSSTIRATSANGTVLDLIFGYGTSNNGAVASITNNLTSGRSQSFTYDYLNRITTAQSTAASGSDCWGQTFGYDATYRTNLSSITSSKCSSQPLSLTITSKNRISNTGFAYDNAGNLTADGTYSYAWNALNQLTSAGGVTYTYDGDGRRVKKANGTLYWYGPGGSVLAETDLSGNLIREFVYFNGERIARRDSTGSIYYFFSDHLGTARVMTNATGATQQESTYYPFGSEQRALTSTVDNRYRFTGLERDAETGLDHTQFRKYSPIQARWLSPDPVCSNCYDPQLLNRYSYVRNNPVNLFDRDGRDPASPWWDPVWDPERQTWVVLEINSSYYRRQPPPGPLPWRLERGPVEKREMSLEQTLARGIWRRIGSLASCRKFLSAFIDNLKSDHSGKGPLIPHYVDTAYLINEIKRAHPTQGSQQSSSTQGNTIVLGTVHNYGNDAASTLLHEGFHLQSISMTFENLTHEQLLPDAAAAAGISVRATDNAADKFAEIFGQMCGPAK